MMDASFLPNLLAWSAQIALVVAVGTLAAAALRIDAAPVRYTFWRALLALCLVLPWLQGRHDAGGVTAATAVTVGTVTAAGAEPAATDMAVPWAAGVAALIAAGIVLRLMWLAAGLAHLRRLRRAGRRAGPGEAHEDLHRVIGARAEIRYVPGILQPVTFGAWRPVVLLPDALRECGWHIQRAVISHELFHVQRRDWIWTLGEEIVRAVFWFHPAMWWVISRVQLTREEAVDELVVLATGQRRTYLEALLAFADATPLAPAAAFARRRHLYRRMLLISKEAVMSPTRVVFTCAVMALVVAVGSWNAISAFPLMQGPPAFESQNGPGPLERRAKPITPENPIPRRTYSVLPIYPPDAGAIGLTVVVAVRATLDEYGRVGEARVLNMGVPASGVESDAAGRRALEAVRRAAVDAVRGWQYDAPFDGPLAFTVMLTFTPGDGTAAEAAGRVDDAVAVRPEDVSRPAAAVAGAIGGRGRAGAVDGAGGPGRAGGRGLGAAPPPPPPPPPRQGSVDSPVRVGGAIRQPTKIRNVSPIYPQEAQDAKVQGIVIIEAVIDTEGRVGQARVLRSLPLLDQAALDAVRQWEFTPTLLNGVPTPVIMTVTVNFSLT